jgi:hypothetical protein
MGAGRSDINPLCARKAARSHPSVIARPQNLMSLLNLLNLMNLLNLLKSWAKKPTAP